MIKSFKIIVIIFLFIYYHCSLGNDKICEALLGIKLGVSTMKDILSIMGPCNKVYLDSQEPETDAYGHAPNAIVFEYTKEISISGKKQLALIDIVFNLSNGKVIRASFQFNSIRKISSKEILAFFGKPDRIVHQPIIDDEYHFEGIVLDCDSPYGEVESWLYTEKGLQVTLSPQDQFIIVDGQKERLVEELYFDLDICTLKKMFPKCK